MSSSLFAHGSNPLIKIVSAFDSDQQWRVMLFTLRKLIDAGVRDHWLTHKQASSLVRHTQAIPAAWLATYRQLRRIRRGDEILKIATAAWNDGVIESSEVAFACARLWYDSGNLTQGDKALATAMRLSPDRIDLYEEQALNRRWRGNKALAIEGAERVMSLDPSAEAQSKWSLFIGMELAKSGQYQEALPHFDAGASTQHDWKEWYFAGVTYSSQDCPRAAEAAFQKAASGQRRKWSRDWLAQDLHLAMGRYQAVVDDLLLAHGNSPQSDAERCLLLAKAYLSLELPQEAYEALRQISIPSPGFEIARLTALSLELAGNFKDSYKVYQSLLGDTSKNSHQVIRALAARTAYWMKDTEAATRHWDLAPFQIKTKDFSPEVDPAFLPDAKAAVDFFRQKQWTQAIVLLERLSLSASSRKNIDVIFTMLGKARRAAGHIESSANAFLSRTSSLLSDPSETGSFSKPLGNVELYAQFRSVLELKQDYVLYESFHGNKTACNPLALCFWLLENRPELKHVWAVTSGCKIHPRLLGDKRVSFVEVNSAGYTRHLATSGILVNNTSFPRYFVRREGQRYLNTWHGIPWKHMGHDSIDNPFAFDNISRNLLQATHLAFPNAHTAEVMLRTQDVRKTCTAKVSLTGQARVDATINSTVEESSTLLSALNVPAENRTVLYAPTWRGTTSEIDNAVGHFIEAIERLSELSDTTILLRVHHFVTSALEDAEVPSNVIVVPDEIDTNELLAVTDLLVSDYSSLIFDFAPLGRPIIKYMYDVDTYTSERGLYFEPQEVPGTNVYALSDLLPAINTSWAIGVPLDHHGFTEGIWPMEDGRSAERTARFLFENDLSNEYPISPDTSRVLFSSVSLNANGITRSLQNLLSTNDTLRGHAHLMIPQNALQRLDDFALPQEVHEHADFTLTSSAPPSTRRENLAWKVLRSAQCSPSSRMLSLLRSRSAREVRRLFGDFEFSAVIDFDGYGFAQSALLALGFGANTKSIYVFHSEFAEEARTKYSILWSTARILQHFDALPSVSEAAMLANKSALSEGFGVPEYLHSVLENTIDPALIRSQADEELQPDIASWYSKPGPHLCIVGRLSVEKNQAVAIKAMGLMSKQGSVLPRLALIGTGPQRAELERLVDSYGLADYVFFAGQVSNPYPAIKRADAVIVTSLHEGQSLVLLEALTLKTPVASTDVPGPRSVLGGGKFGKLVGTTVDSVRELLETFAREEYPKFDEFDAESYVRSAVKAFNELVELR